MPVPLLYFGSTSLVLFDRFTAEAEFCLRVNIPPVSCMSNRDIFRLAFGPQTLEFMLESENFGDCWHGMNVFCMRERHEFGEGGQGWKVLD